MEYYKIVASDLFEHISGKFDCILTNPPYIDPALDRTDTSVKNFEPHNALFGGKDGLELITKIIVEAPAYLTHHGELWIEHEPEQSADIAFISVKYGFTTSTYTDQFNVERYSVLVLQ